MIRSCFLCVVGAVVAACSASSSGGSSSAGSPCDPLAPSPTTLGTLLGVGKDAQSTLYVADIAPGTGSPDGQDRVFVSSGKTLVRQNVDGTGQQGSPPNASYTLSFEPASDTSFSDVRSLVIQQSGGGPVTMSLGAGATKNPSPSDVPLTVVGNDAVAGFSLVNLPAQVIAVADASNGDVIVIVAPMDAYSSSDMRLFYGTAGAMQEEPLEQYAADCCGAFVQFTVDGATYSARLNLPASADGGLGGATGTPPPGTLDTGAQMLTLTQRWPTPQTLTGMSFTCLGG